MKAKKVQKPRNFVALAMIRSGRNHQVHQKNLKEQVQKQEEQERLEELYGDWE